MELDKEILEEIVRVRKNEKISREKLAEAIDFPLGTVNDIESGRTSRIPANFILKACVYLNIDIRRFTNPELYREDTLITVNPENIGDILTTLIKKDAETSNEIEDLKRKMATKSDILEIKEMLKQLLNGKDDVDESE